MLLTDIDRYFRENLQIEQLASTDVSMNGIQVSVENADGTGFEVKKAAFAVDACLESFQRASDQGADLLFVHHGLFWGRPLALTGSHYKRLKFLLDNRMALYAAHLPLDMHPGFGNNAGICRDLGISSPVPFGEYHGVKIGLKGKLDKPGQLDDILESMGLNRNRALSVLPFGPEEIRSAAVVSGGAAEEVYEAIDEKVDLYITGDAAHQIYHTCLENRINLICGGHYHTETYGVRLLAAKTSADLGIETVFLDVPTGL